MMSRKDRVALGTTHKAALLKQLNHRMEVARSKGDQVLLQQLEAEEKYINTQPKSLNLKDLLAPVEVKQSRSSNNNQWGTWFSKFWAMLIPTEPKNS